MVKTSFLLRIYILVEQILKGALELTPSRPVGLLEVPQKDLWNNSLFSSISAGHHIFCPQSSQRASSS